MSWRCVLLLVFLFSKRTLGAVTNVDPNLLEQYIGLSNDTIENQNYFQFTTVNIFQPKFFPNDDPNLLAILRKHLENPKNRRKSMKKIADAFEKDKKKLKEIENQEYVKGLQSKIWPSLIPTGYVNTPEWFLKKTSDRVIFCHLCLVNFADRAVFDRHYLRHFTVSGPTARKKRTRIPRRNSSTLTSNVTHKLRRRVLRRKTTVVESVLNEGL